VSLITRRRALPAVAAAALVLGFVLFGSSGRDDNYITYWPAHSLAEHAEITNINDQRLEQSSSLSFTIAIASVPKGSNAMDAESCAGVHAPRSA
jgi:hypothetical protein